LQAPSIQSRRLDLGRHLTSGCSVGNLYQLTNHRRRLLHSGGFRGA
jgi:hypothetical protein